MKAAPLAVTAVLAGIMLAAAAGEAWAKNDIRGISTTLSLQDALETLELDGATCYARAAPADPVTCDYDARTTMTLYVGPKPNTIVKIVYSFAFGAPDKMRARLRDLYGLRKDHIEGEHKLYTGERLDVELHDDKTGTLSIESAGPPPNDRAGTRR